MRRRFHSWVSRARKRQPALKIGMRVMGIKNYEGMELKGLLGTLICRDDEKRCGVRWDKLLTEEEDGDNGHSLEGKCEQGHGWWVLRDMIILAKQQDYIDKWEDTK